MTCCRKAGFRLRDTKWFLQDTSLQACDVPASSLTALLVRLLVKCLRSQEVTPGCTKIINSMHLGKILIPVTNFDAVIGYMLDSIAKAKRGSRIGKVHYSKEVALSKD